MDVVYTHTAPLLKVYLGPFVQKKGGFVRALTKKTRRKSISFYIDNRAGGISFRTHFAGEATTFHILTNGQ